MIVVLDTNIWIQELGLGSPVGSAVRFFLKHKGAKVALPEVVRLETTRHLSSRLREFVSQMQVSHRQLLTVFRTLKEIVVPDNKAIDAVTEDVFSQTGVPIIDIPFTFQSARKSFEKTIDKVPPCDRSQEFKDGVLWADCVDLLTDDDVYFVTADKAFYANRDTTLGLSKALEPECRNAKHSLKLFPSLAALLEEVKERIEIDSRRIVSQFFETQGDRISQMLASNGVQLGSHFELACSQFATEDPNALYLEFSFEHECSGISDPLSPTGTLKATGDCSYDPASKVCLNMRSHGEELTIVQADGTKTARHYVLLAGSIVLGHREVSHSVRVHLD